LTPPGVAPQERCSHASVAGATAAIAAIKLSLEIAMPLDHDAMKALAHDEGHPRVTVCLAADDRGGERRKTDIKLKNARAALDAALSDHGIEGDEAAALTAPFDAWLQAREPHPIRGGVAAFLSPEGGRVEEVALPRREGAWVDEGYRLAPLWPEPSHRVEAAALIAEEGGARLMRLHEGHLEAMKAELPGSLEDFYGPKEIDGRAAGRMNQPGRQGDAFGETHEQERDEERARYAGALARAAEKALAGTGLPLVLVADERMLGLIRATLDYPHLVTEAETRHPASFKDDAALATAVADLARPVLEVARAAAEERVAAALGRGELASDDPRLVADAAAQGRVDVLLFDPEAGDAEEGQVAAREEPIRAVVDRALRKALATDAEIYATPGARDPLRALMRF
jgi:hypothetical protein